MNSQITIEVEDTRGNTIGAINLQNNNVMGDISLADKDGDYIFNTDNELIRLQLENENNINKVTYTIDIEEIAEELIKQAEENEWYDIEDEDIAYEIGDLTSNLIELVREKIDNKTERDEDDGTIRRKKTDTKQ